MNIQFELGQKSYLRHFAGVIDSLRSRGHNVSITSFWNSHAYHSFNVSDGDHRHLLMKQAKVRNDSIGRLLYTLRCARDDLLYRKIGIRNNSVTHDRIRNHLRFGLSGYSNTLSLMIDDLIQSLSPDQVKLVDQILLQIERHVPHDGSLEDFLSVSSGNCGHSFFKFPRKKKSVPIDLLCITPLVITQLGQTDLVKVAQSLGVPVIFLVNSWDNLTTKGALQVVPDRTIVWNQVQAREAVEYHGVPEGTIRVTGAPRFDEFFLRRPSLSREEFCRQWKIDDSKPIITYLGSSNLISANELSFIDKWIKALRTCNVATLSSSAIILRPHPKFRLGWDALASGYPGIAVCASEILNNDELLYHCLYFADAVVGANTSAELEAAILDKPVFTIRDPEFTSGQDGTCHFYYLLKANGGFVEESNSIPDHIRKLSAAISKGHIPGRNRKFIESFLRPNGIHQAASEHTADAICELAEGKRQ